MKMRLLRLYPAYATLIIIAFILICGVGGVVYALTWSLPALFFVANLVPLKIHMSHLWSVCVEMQFYLFSPFLVKKMMGSEKPWMIPAVVALVSTILNFAIPAIYCPQAWNDGSLWAQVDMYSKKENPGQCFDIYFQGVYELMPTRATPYVMGMYAALLYIRDDKHNYLESK